MNNDFWWGCVKFSFVVLLIFGLMESCTKETEYEKAYRTSKNKTWSEMNSMERKVVRDEIKWYLKKSND